MRCLTKLLGTVATLARCIAVAVEAVRGRPVPWPCFAAGRDDGEGLDVDTVKVDLLLEYALAVAAEADDPFARRLGKIHLLKYAYLADLAYAEKHGTTFTGAPWRFYHYGPWDAGVCNRIDPVIARVGADEYTWQSTNYESDTVRWSLNGDEAKVLLAELDRKLPAFITLAIRRAVRSFGNDTSSLLHHVYTTAPMLHAAPGQTLDFAVAKVEVVSTDEPGDAVKPTARELKRREEAMTKLKSKFQASIASSDARGKRKPPTLKPIYDEIFLNGSRQVDALAGASPEDADRTLSQR
jgi:hypothetical protein